MNDVAIFHILTIYELLQKTCGAVFIIHWHWLCINICEFKIDIHILLQPEKLLHEENRETCIYRYFMKSNIHK